MNCITQILIMAFITWQVCNAKFKLNLIKDKDVSLSLEVLKHMFHQNQLNKFNEIVHVQLFTSESMEIYQYASMIEIPITLFRVSAEHPDMEYIHRLRTQNCEMYMVHRGRYAEQYIGRDFEKR